MLPRIEERNNRQQQIEGFIAQENFSDAPTAWRSTESLQVLRAVERKSGLQDIKEARNYKNATSP